MKDYNSEQLLKKIQLLEAEVQEREKNLNKYKTELIKTNQILNKLLHRIKKNTEFLSQIQNQVHKTGYPKLNGFQISSKFVFGSVKQGDYFDFINFNDSQYLGLFLYSADNNAQSAEIMSNYFDVLQEIQNKPEDIFQHIKTIFDDSQVPQPNYFVAFINRKDLSIRFAREGSPKLFFKPGKSVNMDETLKSSKGVINLQGEDHLIITSKGFYTKPQHSDNAAFSEGLISHFLKHQSPKLSALELKNELFFKFEHTNGQGKKPDIDATLICIKTEPNLIRLVR